MFRFFAFFSLLLSFFFFALSLSFNSKASDCSHSNPSSSSFLRPSQPRAALLSPRSRRLCAASLAAAASASPSRPPERAPFGGPSSSLAGSSCLSDRRFRRFSFCRRRDGRRRPSQAHLPQGLQASSVRGRAGEEERAGERGREREVFT